MLSKKKSQVTRLKGATSAPRPRQRQVHLSNEAQRELVERYRRGALQRELADVYGIERRTVSVIVRRHGATRQRGLDREGVDEAVRRYESGDSLFTIGLVLGVDHGTVRNRLLERGVAMRDSHGRERQPSGMRSGGPTRTEGHLNH